MVGLHRFIYRDQLYVARVYDYRTVLAEGLRDQLDLLRRMDHPNLNRWLGICVHPPHAYSLWRWCERGSIERHIRMYAHRIDPVIALGMIKDIVEVRHFGGIFKNLECMTCRASTTFTTHRSRCSVC